jgi:hypothetical protein
VLGQPENRDFRGPQRQSPDRHRATFLSTVGVDFDSEKQAKTAWLPKPATSDAARFGSESQDAAVGLAAQQRLVQDS